MNEDHIERVVERRMDALDRKYIGGELSDEQYSLGVKNIDAWAERQRNQSTVVGAMALPGAPKMTYRSDSANTLYCLYATPRQSASTDPRVPRR